MKKIILMGMPGSGKSSIGKKIAASKKTGFLDLDLEIQKISGRSPAEIIKRDGEKKFREIEKKVLKETLKKKEGILALGGGTILDQENWELLKKNSFLIYLSVPISVLSQRIFNAAHSSRPLSESLNALRIQFKIRDPIYGTLADRVILNINSEDETVRQILLEKLILKTENIKKAFDGKIVLKNFSMEIFQGERIALLGSNGAGKTTLLTILSGLTAPDEGKITRNFENKKFGMLADQAMLYKELSVKDHLEIPVNLYGVSRERMESVIACFGLEAYQKKSAGDLSKGYQKRLELAIAIAPLQGENTFLVLDEPFSGLDQETAEHLMEHILSLCGSHLALIMSTHGNIDQRCAGMRRIILEKKI